MRNKDKDDLKGRVEKLEARQGEILEAHKEMVQLTPEIKTNKKELQEVKELLFDVQTTLNAIWAHPTFEAYRSKR